MENCKGVNQTKEWSSVFTMPEALSSFISTLNLEIAEAEKNDIILEFTPLKRVNRSKPTVYYGTIDEEFNLPDGVLVGIEKDGKSYSAEIVTSEDFGVVIATEIDLNLNRVYRIKYNMAWILQALVDWMEQMNPHCDRPIARGVLQPDESFVSVDYGVPGMFESDSLNDYQLDAVCQALQTNLTFVWGPPGTGKSRTLSEIIANLLADGKSVLFVSQSNVAVDVVAKQVIEYDEPSVQELRQQGLLLRSGYPSLEPLSQWDGVLPYNIALSQNPVLARLRQELQEKKDSLMRKLKKGSKVQEDIKLFTKGLEALMDIVRDNVAILEGKAPFVATTLAKLSLTKALHSRRFDAVVIDEASMVNVPSVFAALTLAEKHGVVAGDFFQLQPIHQSKHRKVKRWLGQSVFNSSGIRDRVIEKGTDRRLVILKEQYRMADEISALANSLFYGGILENASDQKRQAIPREELLLESRLVFFDVSDCVRCNTLSEGFSRVNPQLAKVSSLLARHYMQQDFSVGIITPYTAQAKEIRGNFLREELKDQVRISTVHKFQGSEKDIILFEVADSFPQKKPSVLVSGSRESFLKDNSPTLPLINVALTRAKSQVIVLADLKYLRSRLSDSNVLLSTLKHMKQMGAVITAKDGVVTKGPQRQLAQAASTLEKKPVVEFNRAGAQEILACDRCGSQRMSIKRGRSYYFFCSKCKKTRTLSEEDLGLFLAIHQPTCPSCSGLIWGEMSRNNWPKLTCVECGRTLDSLAVHRCLVDGNK